MIFKAEMQRYFNDEIAVINRLNHDDINEAMNAIAGTFDRDADLYLPATVAALPPPPIMLTILTRAYPKR